MGTDRAKRTETWVRSEMRQRRGSVEMTQWLSELRRDPDMLRGALSVALDDGFYRLIASGRRVGFDDGPMTGNDHRWRYLVVDGDHIGMRESWAALRNLEAACVGLNDEQLRALKSREMDREDRREARARAAGKGL